ncbi:MAG: hypothetical protein ABIK09_03340 [Pseudomonadota bacterium]
MRTILLGILLFPHAASGQQNIGGGSGAAAPAGAYGASGERSRDVEFDAEDLTKRTTRLSSRIRRLEDDLCALEDRIGALWIAIGALGLGFANDDAAWARNRRRGQGASTKTW